MKSILSADEELNQAETLFEKTLFLNQQSQYMPRDNEYLTDILEACKLVISYTFKMSKDEFLDDLKCQDAVIRRFEIIGEAARRISDEIKSEYHELPWHEMTGMRNMMIHEYDDVDMVIVWETVQRDIPSLISAIERIIS